MKCWFCDGRKPRRPLTPNGGPVCPECYRRLQDFNEWLTTPSRRV